MFLHTPRLIASTTLVIFIVPTNSKAMNCEPQSPPTGQPSSAASKADDVLQAPAPGRMFVTGRVLDPNGKPVPGAAVMVHARSLALPRVPLLSRTNPSPIGNARSDGSGRFRIDAPRTSSSQYEWFGAVALAPGYGAGWVALDPDDDQPAADISLRPERVIHGRLFDVNGRPVPDVTISVGSMMRGPAQDPGRVRERPDGLIFTGPQINEFPGWPRPVLTDGEGRFTVRGVGRDVGGTLGVNHPQFAPEIIALSETAGSEAKPLTAALAPAQILNVRVTYADTGEPVPHAPLEVMAIRGRAGRPAPFETDATGSARVNSFAADGVYNVWAYPPEGQPYLMDNTRITWPKAALEQPVNLALRRGVAIHGWVTEEGSGIPIANATIGFWPRGGEQIRQPRAILERSGPDGSFQLGVSPGSGYLFIQGPSEDYLNQFIGDRMVGAGQPGGHRIYSHALLALDLKPGTVSQDVNVSLRRGATVKGQVTGPDGQPVPNAYLFSRIILDPSSGIWRRWTGRQNTRMRSGRFEIHGLDTDTEVPVYFLDPKRKLGTMVKFSGKPASGGPINVRVEACGIAKARLVDPAGRPFAGRLPRGELTLTMVVTPGPRLSSSRNESGVLAADEGGMSIVDPVNYANGLASDAAGQITFPALIPGAIYRLIDQSASRQAEPQIRKSFTVTAGENLDLGDILIEKPPR